MSIAEARLSPLHGLRPATLHPLPAASCFRLPSNFPVSCAPHDNASATPSSVPRRGRTRQSLGLDQVTLEGSLSSCAGIAPFTGTENVENGGESDAREKNIELNQDPRDARAMSFDEWKKKNGQTTGPSKVPGSRTSKEFAKQVQDFINADIEKRHSLSNEGCDNEDDDFPLYVDEEDPYWLDEPDEGWGFRVSDLFTEDFKIKKANNDKHDEEADVLDFEWDLQPETWSATDVDSMNWRTTVFDDPSPLVVLLYERYGNKGRECYHVLRELEDAANHIWGSNRLPPRLARINASLEVDLMRALRVNEVPTFLFIKAGKLLHQQSGYLTADNLKRMIGYFYHGAARPTCLKRSQVPEDISST